MFVMMRGDSVGEAAGPPSAPRDRERGFSLIAPLPTFFRVEQVSPFLLRDFFSPPAFSTLIDLEWGSAQAELRGGGGRRRARERKASLPPGRGRRSEAHARARQTRARQEGSESGGRGRGRARETEKSLSRSLRAEGPGGAGARTEGNISPPPPMRGQKSEKTGPKRSFQR